MSSRGETEGEEGWGERKRGREDKGRKEGEGRRGKEGGRGGGKD